MKHYSALFYEIVFHPKVMIARKIVHFNAKVGEFGDFTQESGETFGNYRLIFVPEVEHIAKQIHGTCLVFDAIEEAYETTFLHATALNGKTAKMCIGEEIDGFHIDVGD
jgi:hypothetical protein